MRKSYFRLLEGVLFSLPMLFASCGNGDNALEEIINGGGSGGGSTAVTEITIDLASLDAKYLNDEKTQLNLKVGDEVTLSFNIKPAELADAEVTLTSDDPTIVSIDGKKVKALKEGTTKVTAKAGDKTATCEVTVLPTLSTPLTVEAAVAGAKVTFKADNANVEKDIEYSTDGGATWTSGNTGGSGVEVTLTNIGDKVMFRGDNSQYGKDNEGTPDTYNTISCTADCYVYGNIMSLIDKTGFATNKVLPTGTYTFYNLFKDNTHLKNHPNAAYTLELPATTLKEYCYRSMFSGCKALVTPPVLPATKLENSCYSTMFRSCFSMVTPPALPATELKDNCYQSMFDNCKSLETTPRLPATELKNGCYYSMFEGCTSLKEAWVKANVKVGAPDYECDNMFDGCTNASTSQFHTGDSKANWTAAFPNLSDWQFSAYE